MGHDQNMAFLRYTVCWHLPRLNWFLEHLHCTRTNKFVTELAEVIWSGSTIARWEARTSVSARRKRYRQTRQCGARPWHLTWRGTDDEAAHQQTGQRRVLRHSATGESAIHSWGRHQSHVSCLLFALNGLDHCYTLFAKLPVSTMAPLYSGFRTRQHDLSKVSVR